MAKPREIEGLEPDVPFAHAAAAVIEARTAELLTCSEGVLDVAELERVHDMRVATRRLRAALELFAACFPRKPHRRLLKEVKAVADALGERRDRDVAIATLSGFAASLPRPDRPGIDSLIETYRSEQDEANEQLEPFVDGARLEALRSAALELAEAARATGSADSEEVAG